MSAADELHARCIREEPDLQTIDLTSNGGLDEICDLALNLLDFVRDQPTPALRYAALEGVVYHLVEALAPKPQPTE